AILPSRRPLIAAARTLSVRGAGSAACGSAARSLVEPRHCEVLQLDPVVDAVLRALAAEARLLNTAERRDLRRDEARVDADDAVVERFGDAPDTADVAAVEVRGESVRRVVRGANRLLLGREARDAGDGPEGLLAAHRHLRLHVHEHGRLEERVAELVRPSADEQLRAALARVVDVTSHLLE